MEETVNRAAGQEHISGAASELPPRPILESQPILETRRLRFSYSKKREKPALDMAGLQVNPGERIIFLGPNGSGKSTLLKLVNRLLQPEAGTIYFLGRDITLDNNFRRSSVYVHQNPMLITGTVFSNVAYGLRLRKLPPGEIEQRVAETLSILGLAGMGKRRASTLSGGEAQRVAIARALVLKPKLLLLDEPTANVDSRTVRRIEEALQEFSKSGSAVMISSHDIAFAYRTGTRVFTLSDGEAFLPAQNLLSGIYCKPGGEGHGEGYGEKQTQEHRKGHPELAIFRSGGLEISCPDLEGDHIRAVIDYDRIILSKEELDSSARNRFSGIVVSINPVPGKDGLADVATRVNKVHLTTRVSQESVRSLELEPGSGVWLSFKASAVRLF